MLSFVWPVAMIITANIIYQICAKSVPGDVNPMASLTLTYLVGAALSFVLYLLLFPDTHFIRECGKCNWSSFVMGVVLVGFEAGFIYAYKAGWPVSALTAVQGSIVIVVLLIIGVRVYGESFSWTKAVGVAFSVAALIFLNI